MTAYDATHGYSDQYILEYENFLIEANILINLLRDVASIFCFYIY